MVYNYTKPRGPVAAMYNSPGPCHGLPSLLGKKNHDPRSMYYVGPAYHFGLKYGKLTDQPGPGPCYMLHPRILRTGRESAPMYTITSRQNDNRGFLTPGPGSYAPERSGVCSFYQKSPAYTFGKRYRSRSVDNSPGPSAYTIPHVIGNKGIESDKTRAPSYTLSQKTKFGSLYGVMQQTPGPGAYTMPKVDKVKTELPKYTISFKHDRLTNDNHLKPGPGAYESEKVWLHKTKVPKFSFGIKHSQYSGTLADLHI